MHNTPVSCCQVNVIMAQPGLLLDVAEQDVQNVVLAQTSAGACLRGFYGRTDRPVSLKLLPLRSASEREQWSDQYLQHLAAVRRACSDRVLVPLGWYRARCLVGLVSDWMPGSSLHSLLYETQLYPEFPLALRLRILLDVAEGLSHLHAVPVSHQSLKPTNVLLDQQCRAKLCDFGQRTGQRMGSTLHEGGTHCFRDLVYLSPEVLRGGVSSTEADVYSFGMLLWETLHRRAPCEKIRHVSELLLYVQRGEWPGAGDCRLPPEVPLGHVLTQLMTRCWSADPQSRPSAVDCMLELKKALATFDLESPARAAAQLKERKERALLGSKAQQAGEMKMEINNMELYGGCQDAKSAGTKTLPMDIVQATTPGPLTLNPKSVHPNNLSPPTQGKSPPLVSSCTETLCCQDARLPRPRSASERRSQRQSPSPPSSLHSPASAGTLNPLKPSPPGPPAAGCQGVPIGCPTGPSCCQILREMREVIVWGMTEGRLNYLLDVLRARQALSREAYELITAAMTLPARTRSLLDTCLCLGEGTAALVASTLGLVSMVTARPHPCHLYN
ncbi:receptor-interacting serine/threonine-protein kinase 2 isoform X1 [Anguilla rostrata]|uniref:receptor-interacting serine/threonine-protein kinase 2 isoform X1 n=1 Tax=Anguilla rostrata TaxID=7938 RepID=UPI0030CDA740